MSRINEMFLHYIVDKNVFQFDFKKDLEGGIINLCKPELYTTDFKNHIYKFGYKFNDDVESKIRTEFVNQLKQISNRSWSDKENYDF